MIMRANTMRTVFTCILLLTTPPVLAQTAGQYFDDGINYLSAMNLDAANLSFSNAVALSPANPTNNFFYALTQLATLPDQPAGSAFLSSLGIPESGRNLYDWTARAPRSDGHLVAPVGVNADEFAAQIRTNVLVTLTNAEHNLSMVTGPRFSVELTENETHLSDVTVDYGDVLMMQAMLESAVFCSYTIYSWNMDAQLTDISTILNQESWAALLATYTNAFTVTTTNDLNAARGAFTNAINLYLAASQFIRVDRPPGVKALFNLSPDQARRELEFRETLTNILASLTGPPVTLTANSNYTVSAAAYFSGTNGGPRAAFPQFQGNEFVWNSFADVTFGGVVTGFTEGNLGSSLASKTLTATLNSPRINLTPFYSFTNSVPNNVIVQGADGNFYGVAPYTSYDPYSGPIGYGSIYQVTPSGSFRTIYSFGAVTNSYGTPLDGSYPNALLLGTDGNFYGTTEYGGIVSGGKGSSTNVYLEGTVFRLSTNGSLATLPFYYTNILGYSTTPSGYSPSGILTQGGDGNLYGTTLHGGSDDSGVIFKITPDGALTNVYTIGSNPNDGYDINSLNVTSDGTIYATSPDGGVYGYGAILKILPNGQLTTLYSFGASQDMYGSSPNSLLLGKDGNFYGTTGYGGTNRVGTAFRCSSNGAFAPLVSFQRERTNANYPSGFLVQSANGRIYGEAGGGANRKGAIFELTTNGSLQTVAWLNQDSGENTTAGLVGGANGNFYGATSDGGRFRHGTFFQLFADSLQISPASGFMASGAPEGPFNPSATAFVLTNAGTTAINWAAAPTVPWLTVSSAGGLLSAGASTGVTVSLNANAGNLDLGFFSGAVWFTNLSSASSQGRQFSVNAGNGSFESGSFAGWTLAGDTSYTFVGDNLYWPDYVYSGDDAALLGTSGAAGTLSQTLPTVPGTVYLISFWLDNPVGGVPSLFRVSWAGQTLFAQTNLSQFGWTNMQFTAAANSSSTTLQFTFQQDYDYFGLDDIQVTPTTMSAPPVIVIQSAKLIGQNFEFSWNTTPTSLYQVQFTGNLNKTNWSNLGVPIAAPGSSLNATDIISTNVERFYRVFLTN
jgi:uncharacterized repeat protein (TIGR03803 family)